PIYEDDLPTTDSLLSVFSQVTGLMREGRVLSCWTPTYGGVAEGVLKMGLGNKIGFAYDASVRMDDIFGYRYGSFILELADDADVGVLLGRTTDAYELRFGSETVSLDEIQDAYEAKLEPVFACNISQGDGVIEKISYTERNTA
ncbi:MAG TPA: phosphoribosylformylglycinamidine synthase, partial [Methanocorpusculum sp.]|nr:phosphoribosylformylglycinamidine synthase [Methanocorpusculum sp.]